MHDTIDRKSKLPEKSLKRAERRLGEMMADGKGDRAAQGGDRRSKVSEKPLKRTLTDSGIDLATDLATSFVEMKARIAALERQVAALSGAPPAKPPAGFTTLKRASFVTGLSVECLRQKAARGVIPARWFDGKWYIDLGMLEDSNGPNGRNGAT